MGVKKQTKGPDQSVGRKAYFNAGQFDIEVKILKYEKSYGRDRYLVAPVAGRGEAVVEKIKDIHD